MNTKTIKTENELIDEAVKAALGIAEGHGVEVNNGPAVRTVNEEDLRIAAAAGMEPPAGSSPEQIARFEELRKIAMKSNKEEQ